jgi:hypothetical protein
MEPAIQLVGVEVLHLVTALRLKQHGVPQPNSVADPQQKLTGGLMYDSI